jgi:hypothetical protein
MTVVTRQEREKFVLDLYNQGKTYKDIAKEARISPRDIKVILEKAVHAKEEKIEKERQDNHAENTSEQYLSLSSKAYKLFSKHKTPVEVAIALDLTEPEVTELFQEYWNLKRLHKLTLIYEELGEYGTGYFLKLYQLAKNQNLGPDEVSNLLTIANNDLPSVEYRFQDLKKQVNSLESRRFNLNRTLMKQENQIISSSRFLRSCYFYIQKEKKQIDILCRERMGLNSFITQFKDNDEEYENTRHGWKSYPTTRDY